MINSLRQLEPEPLCENLLLDDVYRHVLHVDLLHGHQSGLCTAIPLRS